MTKITLPIQGMHCRSCELLIEEELLKIPGVSQVKVSCQTNTAELNFKHRTPGRREMAEAVERAGYTVGVAQGPVPWFTIQSVIWKQVALSTMAVGLVVWFLAKSSILSGLTGVGSGQVSSLWLVALVGLTAGLSTCMALVGGLVMGLVAHFLQAHPEADFKAKLEPQLWFQVGRIGGFFVLGGLIGLIGSVFQFSPVVLGLLTIGVGLVMLILGLQLTELSPKVTSLSFSLPGGLAKLFGLRQRQSAEYSVLNSVAMGGLTFFLPCGFTQAMQLLAMSSGSFIRGAAIMSVFAIGTAPGLLGIGSVLAAVKNNLMKPVFRFVGVILIFLAVFNLSNGYNLTGWTALESWLKLPKVVNADTSADSSVQIVRMVQNYGGYNPRSFTVKKGQKVRWVIDSQAPSCAASILLPKYGIRSSLQPGENIFEFTPTEVGTVKFSCGMGMYTGVFTVIN